MRAIEWCDTIANAVAWATTVLDGYRQRQRTGEKRTGENLRGVLLAIREQVQRLRLQLLSEPNEMHHVHSRHWLPPLRAWRGRWHLEARHVAQWKAGCARRAVGTIASRRSTERPRGENQSVLILHMKACERISFDAMLSRIRINFSIRLQS